MSDQSQPTTASDLAADLFGANAWLVEEKYQEYLANPSSVDEQWRALFSNGIGQHGPAGDTSRKSEPFNNGHDRASNGSAPGNGAAPGNGISPAAPPALPPAPPRAAAPASGAPSVAAPPVATPPTPAAAPTEPGPSVVAPAGAGANAPVSADLSRSASAPSSEPAAATPLRGAAGRIVENMVTSLGVPTATSVHPLPAKLLEVNRRILNEHLGRASRGKVSFTHLIAFAVVRALGEVPALNASFVDDADGKGTPGVLRHAHVNLGIAIDVQRSSGERSLVVPGIKDADTLDFPAFVAAYEDLVTRARVNQLAVEDFSGVTVSLTNPGTLGTTQSVPRLMAGQGAIIGIGALDYPVEFSGVDPAKIAALGVGKVVTLTSTYDHRIIQGAASGEYLKHVHELLLGERDFYDTIFAALEIPEPPARWGRDTASGDLLEATRESSELAVRELIARYRLHGHLGAWIDPLATEPPELPEDLDPAYFGLTVWDLDRTFHTGGLAGTEQGTLAQILDVLRSTYCATIGIEYLHVQDLEERGWIQAEVEAPIEALSAGEQRYILERLNAAESFERFLQARYIGQRRFSLEGSESTVAFLDAILEAATQSGAVDAVLGMAHRGRLNALANIVGKPYTEIFADFEGSLDPTTVQGSGDVKYHKGGAGKWVGRDGLSLPVTMAPNPSHLEAVNPVVLGMARAKQDRIAVPGEFPVTTILVHGDASFAGQGVVAETLNLSLLEGYEVGGTVHLVINNQIGFTTPPGAGRSTHYATDVAKAIEAPIFHVNGDDPEAVVRVARLAAAYRERFHKDVVIDLLCYRLHGHNEGDDPSYTQPLMYKAIATRPSVRQLYTETLIRRGVTTLNEAEASQAAINELMARSLEEVRANPLPHMDRLPARPELEVPALSFETGISRAAIDALAYRLHHAPQHVTVHPKLASQLAQREQLFQSGEVDWSLGEALAYGSLLLEGVDVRLTGQDSRRGTFSHRHAVLVDYETGEDYTPLAALTQPLDGAPPVAPEETAGKFEIRDSLLSEYAALGFEYGYSVEQRDALVLWEAQFGDFVNGAQIIIDNFIVAAEEKWGQFSGLVMLLPHGYEGAGPEHSSARIERFLSLAVDGNITVAQPTTAGQFFHLMRAQAHQTLRRPLVVVAPKSLLRSRSSRSPVEVFVSGAFAEALDDPAAGSRLDPASVQRVIVCSGKIAFEAMERRDAIGAPHAVVRVEQLAPWPDRQLAAVLGRYPNAQELVWLQDEPENMGAWNFVREPLAALAGDRLGLRVVSRRAAGSPATGSHLLHELEIAALLEEAVGPKPNA